MMVGGQSRISLFVLKDPDTVRMNGVRATSVQKTAIARKTMREIRKRKRGRCTATVCVRASVAILVIRPHVEESPLDERHREDANKEKDPEGARVAHVQIAEALTPEEVGHGRGRVVGAARSEEHTSELQSPCNLVCRLLLEKKKNV